MSIARIYQPVPLVVGAIIKLDERASHHLARVLRAEKGDNLTLFNGEGGEYAAVISQIDKKIVTVTLVNFLPREAESNLDIRLAQGIAKGEKMDFIVQKAVELGVKTIIPLLTERCNVRLDSEREEKRLAHWRGIIISACEQCGRNKLPILVSPMLLKEWLLQENAELKLTLSPHASSSLIQEKSINSVALLIGPEGGLSGQEVQLAQENGFQNLCLGPRILRTETATITALSVIQSHLGDFTHHLKL